MKVAIEYVHWLIEEKSKINREKLSDIELFENGMKLDIPQKVIDDFDFTGLSNIDFILSDFRDVVDTLKGEEDKLYEYVCHQKSCHNAVSSLGDLCNECSKKLMDFVEKQHGEREVEQILG